MFSNKPTYTYDERYSCWVRRVVRSPWADSVRRETPGKPLIIDEFGFQSGPASVTVQVPCRRSIRGVVDCQDAVPLENRPARAGQLLAGVWETWMLSVVDPGRQQDPLIGSQLGPIACLGEPFGSKGGGTVARKRPVARHRHRSQFRPTGKCPAHTVLVAAALRDRSTN